VSISSIAKIIEVPYSTVYSYVQRRKENLNVKRKLSAKS